MSKLAMDHPLQYWYVAATSKELKKAKTQAIKICGVALVLFRNSAGQPCALQDRCPHRNAPLSLGEVVTGELACPYHGWQFNGRGERTLVPGLEHSPPSSENCSVPSYACREQDGFIWVCPQPGHVPRQPPMALPNPGSAYLKISLTLDLNGSLHAALENALDVAHTSFIHRGLFRGIHERNEIRVETRAIEQGFEAEYIGEKVLPGGREPPPGVLPEHWDRFMMPSTVQVEYRAGETSHSLITGFHTPIEERQLRVYFVSYMKMPRAARLLKPMIRVFMKRVLRQDIDILARQTETILAFGGEDYQSTRMDIFGPQINRFFDHAKQHERGEVDSALPDYTARSMTMTI